MRTLALFVLALGTLAAGSRLTAAENDKPVPTKEAAGKMTLPEGFKATLFAGEPDIVQPIAFTFDDRGRMWVVECLSYPKWSRDGKGSDRVVILEDTDGDGVHDKKTVFLDGGVNLSGIEYGFGGVWLCSLPNLTFIPVLEGDKPGRPEVKLDGWNMIDTKHNIFNSLVWGPDGWLYGCNGIQAKSWVGAPDAPREKRTYLDCGVWRYHPTRQTFEAVAHGTTNPFGLDFDEHGEMFITNCVIDHLFHFVPGGHYERMYGQDANPHTYGLMKSCVDYRHWGGGAWTDSRANKDGTLKKEHDDAGGGHAHAGAAIYLSDNFPKEYRNTLFTANIHGSRLNNDSLERTKSGMKGVRRPDFMFANDPWFRGICVKVGPEGALYVSDWCDTGECHNYDKADTTNGRIYRVVYKNAKPFKGDVSGMTDAELVKLQLSPNEWLVRKARRVLHERAAAGGISKPAADGLSAIFRSNDSTVSQRLRALWAMRATGALSYNHLIGDGLAAPHEAVRAWSARLLLEGYPNLAVVPNAGPQQLPAVRKALTEALRDRSRTEQCAYVRVATISAIQRADAGVRQELLDQWLVALTEKSDPAEVQMMWYALSRELPLRPDDAGEFLYHSQAPLIRRNIVRFVMSLPDLEPALDKVLARIRKYHGEEIPSELLGEIRVGLTGMKAPKPPASWAEAFAQFRASEYPAVRREAEAIAVIYGDKDAVAALLKRVTDTGARAAERRAAVELLAPRKLPGFARTLHELLADADLRGTVIRALAQYPDANTPAAILKAYPTFTAQEKADAVQTLAARVGFAKELLDAVEKGTVPRAEVPVTTARQVLALNDKATTERLEKVWGKITPVAKERAALMKRWKGELSEEALKKADPANGRVLFTKHCANCHKMFGEGQTVGPELTGSQRSNLDYILENVLDPSAVVPREFQMVNFTMNDDRVVSGIVLRETKGAVTVRTTNDTLTLTVADVVARKQTAVSIMPEGLFDAMKPAEVRDLVAYLRAKEQVPPPR